MTLAVCPKLPEDQVPTFGGQALGGDVDNDVGRPCTQTSDRCALTWPDNFCQYRGTNPLARCSCTSARRPSTI